MDKREQVADPIYAAAEALWHKDRMPGSVIPLAVLPPGKQHGYLYRAALARIAVLEQERDRLASACELIASNSLDGSTAADRYQAAMDVAANALHPTPQEPTDA